LSWFEQTKRYSRQRILARIEFKDEQDLMRFGFDTVFYCCQLRKRARFLLSDLTRAQSKTVQVYVHVWQTAAAERALNSSSSVSIKCRGILTAVLRTSQAILQKKFQDWRTRAINEVELQYVSARDIHLRKKFDAKVARCRLAVAFQDLISSLAENSMLQHESLAVYECKHRRVLQTWRQHAPLNWMEKRFHILQRISQQTELRVLFHEKIDAWRKLSFENRLLRRAVKRLSKKRAKVSLFSYHAGWRDQMITKTLVQRQGSKTQAMHFKHKMKLWHLFVVKWQRVNQRIAHIQRRRLVAAAV